MNPYVEELFYGIDTDSDNAAFDGVFFVNNPYYGSLSFYLSHEDIAYANTNDFTNQYISNNQ